MYNAAESNHLQSIPISVRPTQKWKSYNHKYPCLLFPESPKVKHTLHWPNEFPCQIIKCLTLLLPNVGHFGQAFRLVIVGADVSNNINNGSVPLKCPGKSQRHQDLKLKQTSIIIIFIIYTHAFITVKCQNVFNKKRPTESPNARRLAEECKFMRAGIKKQVIFGFNDLSQDQRRAV